MPEQPRFNDADGMAALGICESLLLALTDLKIISRARRARLAYRCCHLTHQRCPPRRRRRRSIEAVVEDRAAHSGWQGRPAALGGDAQTWSVARELH